MQKTSPRGERKAPRLVIHLPRPPTLLWPQCSSLPTQSWTLTSNSQTTSMTPITRQPLLRLPCCHLHPPPSSPHAAVPASRPRFTQSLRLDIAEGRLTSLQHGLRGRSIIEALQPVKLLSSCPVSLLQSPMPPPLHPLPESGNRLLRAFQRKAWGASGGSGLALVPLVRPRAGNVRHPPL